MKLEKAIEILTLDVTFDFEGDTTDLQDALKLGIEALKRIELQRSPKGFGYSYKLPGETTEEEGA